MQLNGTWKPPQNPRRNGEAMKFDQQETIPLWMPVRRIVRLIFASLALLALAACPDVPKEAVTLSATLGRDMAEVHRSHRALALRYFARTRQDVDRFVQEQYRPALVRDVVASVNFVELFKTEIGKPDGDPLRLTTSFVTRLTLRIERTRQELLAPLEEQEKQLIASIDDAYQKMQNAHSIVTGHLASIRQVQDVQAELLKSAGLSDLRQRFLEKSADLSEDIAKLTTQGEEGLERLDKLEEKLAKIKERISRN